MEEGDVPRDVWSDWLLHRRHADNPEYGDVIRAAVEGYADRVLEGAQLSDGMTLADIGTGEGLVAFRAIDRIGSSLRVVMTEISEWMLQHAEAVARQRNVTAQCTFLKCTAENLSGIADSSIDVVTTRAVLAYVADKKQALREFHRILKPGGRISVAEPIFQDEAFYARALRRRLENRAGQPEDRFLKLLHRWKAAQYPDTEEACAKSPIANYSERDLLNMVNETGFTNIHLQLHIDAVPSAITSWEVFLKTSPHPWAPSLEQIFVEQFTSEERQLFEEVIRPAVESGRHTTTDRTAYLQAVKSPA